MNDVMVSLLAEVALNYVEVRSDQALLSITESNLTARSETYDITRWRHEAGLTTQLDEEQAKASLEQVRAQIPTLRTSLEQAKYRLAVLLGKPPGALSEVLAEAKAVPVAPADVAVGVPAEAMRRRPDVRSAERKLAAQTAEIGAAEAARYPSFSLLGSIGVESLEFANLYSASARAAQGAAKAAWTLFDGGSIRQNIKLQTAMQEEALSFYESTVLGALQDVENSLVAFANEQGRRDSLAVAVQSSQNAFELARYQYSSGLVGFQTVLDTQQSLLSAQDQLAISESKVTSNLISLYKALGGGWTPMAKSETRDPKPEAASKATTKS
jgi:NodT family efflux transporter outer membrane factor (OMF) lipoprotein